MGCWNATCNISNLPIFWGDKVVLIPLVKVYSNRTLFNPCNPTDNFVPFGFPIFGEYDDYGGLENAHTCRWNEQHLRSFKYYFEERDEMAGEKYRPVELKDDFDSFVRQVLCCHEGCYIDLDNRYFHPDGKAMVTYMMIHQDIYDTLFAEMANRIPYNHQERFYDALIGKLQQQLAKAQDACPAREECSTPIVYDMFEDIMLRDICENVFGYSNYFHQCFIWKDLAQILVGEVDAQSEMLSYVATMKTWTMVLNYLRKGYLCDSGAGGQSGEMRLHLILADCVHAHVEMTRKNREWDADGDAEPVYLW